MERTRIATAAADFYSKRQAANHRLDKAERSSLEQAARDLAQQRAELDRTSRQVEAEAAAAVDEHEEHVRNMASIVDGGRLRIKLSDSATVEAATNKIEEVKLVGNELRA